MATTTTNTEDKSETEDKNDWLGYGVYAETLWARIERALDKTDLGDDPLVIGLFGEWGAGKSYLLNMMKDEAKSWARDRIGMRKQLGGDGVVLTVPVLFQPWKYEHEEHLLVPMMLHILYALQEYTSKTRTNWDEAGGVTQAAWEGVKKSMPKVVGLFEKATKGAIAVIEPHTAVAAGIGLGVAKSAAGLLKPREDKPNAFKNYKNSNDGRFYYELHQTLTDVTRPTREKGLLKEHFNYPFRLNFVVFIDDLDRCLPEKAVQTLEMIKTVFNIDSFAFVLALDDEVIERGIAHRYKDYALVDKKQQMPITGFEYLEKIVHLPFRLPALTIDQAENFVRRQEKAIEENAALRWFEPIEATGPQYDGAKTHDGSMTYRGPQRSDLLALALVGFDAYVPRKLIRLVELVHQFAKIASIRNMPISFEANAPVDARILLSLALIQLFQPELYRLLRRKQESFPLLLAAFAKTPTVGGNSSEAAYFSDANVANVDLWRWSISNKQDEKIIWNPESLGNIPNFVVKEIASRYDSDKGARANAQQVRFPLVSQIVEHRAAQRHVFDVLKLMKELARSMEATDSNPYKLAFAPKYTTFLAQTVTVANQGNVMVADIVLPMPTLNATASSRFTISNPDGLAADLMSEDLAIQANVVGRHDLRESQKIESRSFAQLNTALETRLTANASQADKQRLMLGLSYIAVYLDKDQGGILWGLVNSSVDVTKPVNPKLRALWYDVRAALGCDDRFAGDYALAVPQKEANVENGKTRDADEAPPGFVKVPNGNYYISRYPVTVAQYAVFKASDEFKIWSTSRSNEIRSEPKNWSDQRTNQNRPVMNVNWFEATAYAQWLQLHLEAGDLGTLVAPKGYVLRLPTEGEWELAAQGGKKGDFPWGDEIQDIDQRANVAKKVGHSSTVGSYRANDFGLFDMAGNVWEWQSNVFSVGVYDKTVIKNAAEFKKKNHPDMSLRGGSWIGHPDDARCSYSYWNHPDNLDLNLGFRLVLSLADSEI